MSPFAVALIFVFAPYRATNMIDTFLRHRLLNPISRSVSFSRLCIEWAIVVVVTGGLIYSLNLNVMFYGSFTRDGEDTDKTKISNTSDTNRMNATG
ncbi:MAG: hypothetical protein ACYS6K_09645 [Planctomycetota bacterium]|jgi:hypothetical protein